MPTAITKRRTKCVAFQSSSRREPRFTIRMGPKLRRVSAGACRLISSRMGERSVRTSALVIFRRITHCRTVRPQTAFVITGFRLLR